MPITYQIDSERNLVLVEGHGVITDKDFPKFRTKLISDPLFRPGMKELADYRSAEKFDLSTDGLSKFLDLEISIAPLMGDYRIAIATCSDLLFGFVRMYMTEIGETLPNVNVFRDIDEAEAWLNDESEVANADPVTS